MLWTSSKPPSSPGAHATSWKPALRRLLAINRSQARLTIRLGRQHPITRAYASALLAVGGGFGCADDSGGILDGSAVGHLARLVNDGDQASRYFNDSSTALLEARVGSTLSHNAPSGEDIGRLHAGIVRERDACEQSVI
jgi:hypothetical protein